MSGETASSLIHRPDRVHEVIAGRLWQSGCYVQRADLPARLDVIIAVGDAHGPREPDGNEEWWRAVANSIDGDEWPITSAVKRAATGKVEGRAPLFASDLRALLASGAPDMELREWLVEVRVDDDGGWVLTERIGTTHPDWLERALASHARFAPHANIRVVEMWGRVARTTSAGGGEPSNGD